MASWSKQEGPLPTFFRYVPWLGALALLTLGASAILGLIRDRSLAPISILLLALAIPFALDLFWQAVKHYPEIKLEDDGLTVRVLGRFTQKVKWHNIQEVIETETDSYAILVSPHMRSPFLSSGLAPWDRPFQPVIFLSKRTPGADKMVTAIRQQMA